MTCPSCNRILASTLSVCPTCGTMIHDSVREELAVKIYPAVRREKPVLAETSVVRPSSSPVAKHQETSQIMTKATSATLVEFQNKNTDIPDWRLQLRNSVRKRLDGHRDEPISVTTPRVVPMISGATALNVEIDEQLEPGSANPQLAKALQRIEESRRKYMIADQPVAFFEEPVMQHPAVRQFPQIIPNQANEFMPRQEFSNNVANFVRPVANEQVQEEGIVVEKFKTNKLPPLPAPAQISSSFGKEQTVEARKIDIEDVELDYIELKKQPKISTPDVAYIEAKEAEVEETDDYAPISMRFNAGLFDLLICSFTSLLLLSPFMLLNGRFFSMEGFFAFVATCAIVMFIYLTTSIGFLGRTFGMRLFSLEVIDIEENAYPSLHQAAVSSSVYLLSLALGGIGFATMLVNSEKRAAHDLLSGTIVVREY